MAMATKPVYEASVWCTAGGGDRQAEAQLVGKQEGQQNGHPVGDDEHSGGEGPRQLTPPPDGHRVCSHELRWLGNKLPARLGRSRQHVLPVGSASPVGFGSAHWPR